LGTTRSNAQSRKQIVAKAQQNRGKKFKPRKHSVVDISWLRTFFFPLLLKFYLSDVRSFFNFSSAKNYILMIACTRWVWLLRGMCRERKKTKQLNTSSNFLSKLCYVRLKWMCRLNQEGEASWKMLLMVSWNWVFIDPISWEGCNFFSNEFQEMCLGCFLVSITNNLQIYKFKY
jgi:hypothetical protein